MRPGVAVILASVAFATGPLYARQRAATPPGDAAVPGPDVIVTGVRDIVVNGRARHCYPRAGDPLDKVNVSASSENPLRQSVVEPNGGGGYRFDVDDEPVTGPDFWQRAGRGLDQYVFRAPPNGRPMCIGAIVPDRGTFGQFRRVVDAAPYRGKRVRFTAWVATGNAHMVRFWLAAGFKTRTLYNGGNTNNRSWGGNHGWTPVMIEVGPVAPRADHISYGFLLQGLGDLWVYKPALEIVPDGDPYVRTGDVSVIGSDKR